MLHSYVGFSAAMLYTSVHNILTSEQTGAERNLMYAKLTISISVFTYSQFQNTPVHIINTWADKRVVQSHAFPKPTPYLKHGCASVSHWIGIGESRYSNNEC